jgi:drug/metabolite transporter superfamily protein YnfA
MRVIRIGLPTLIGALLIFIAVQTTRTGLGDYGESAIQAFHAGLIPAAVGVALLLAALAIARRSRAGYLLGLAVATLMAAAGGLLIVLEIPFMQAGGEGAAFGGGFIVVAVIWSILWAGYGLSVWRARSTFATGWQPNDRRFGIVLAALVLFTTGAEVALGVVDSSSAANRAVDEARAQQLVNGTSIAVRVVEVALEPGSATTGGSQAVARLTLDVTVQAVEPYQLEVAPGLCLTDLATYEDPAFKPDVYCWGTPSPADVVRGAFADLSVPADARTVRLVLERGTSQCAFPPGAWSAELELAPRLSDTGGGIGPAPAIYTRAASFQVDGESAAPASGADPAGSACLASTVSP